MADYTVTTGPVQDAMLAYVLGKVNASRATEGLPALTNAQLVSAIFAKRLAEWFQEFTNARRQRVVDAVTISTDAVLSQVESILGVVVDADLIAAMEKVKENVTTAGGDQRIAAWVDMQRAARRQRVIPPYDAAARATQQSVESALGVES
jgi:hypothetical protein